MALSNSINLYIPLRFSLTGLHTTTPSGYYANPEPVQGQCQHQGHSLVQTQPRMQCVQGNYQTQTMENESEHEQSKHHHINHRGKGKRSKGISKHKGPAIALKEMGQGDGTRVEQCNEQNKSVESADVVKPEEGFNHDFKEQAEPEVDDTNHKSSAIMETDELASDKAEVVTTEAVSREGEKSPKIEDEDKRNNSDSKSQNI